MGGDQLAVLLYIAVDDPAGAYEIEAAVEASRFDNLRKQEDESGFQEKAPKVKNFFRRGTVGGWREELTKEQIDRVIEINCSGMERLGYLGGDREVAKELKPLELNSR